MKGRIELIESSYDTKGKGFNLYGNIYFNKKPVQGEVFCFQTEPDSVLSTCHTGTVEGLREMSENEIRFRTKRSMYVLHIEEEEIDEGTQGNHPRGEEESPS